MSSTLSYNRRALRLAPIVVASVALLAACNTDDSVSPKSAQIPTTAQSAVIGPNRPTFGRVRQTYVDFVGPVGGMSLRLRDAQGIPIVDFRENSAPDIDPTPGKLEMKLAEGEYSICMMAAPVGYWFVGIQAESCIWFHTKRDSIAQLPPITSYPFHSVYWGVSDGTVDSSFSLIPLGPSTFTVKNKMSWKTVTVVDNGENDFDPALGKFALILDTAGDFEICQTDATPGYYKAQPWCQTATVVSNVPNFAGWFISAKNGTGISRK
jgi:hypothetical protein